MTYTQAEFEELIVALLSGSGGMRTLDIAAKLRMSENTLRPKLHKMRKAGNVNHYRCTIKSNWRPVMNLMWTLNPVTVTEQFVDESTGKLNPATNYAKLILRPDIYREAA